MKKTSLFIVAILGILMMACQPQDSRSKGETITETRSLDPFNKLKVSGIINVSLSQGDSESLRIEGDAKWVEKLEVKQRGDRLTIHLKEQNKTFGKKEKIEVHLQLRELRELEFEGAGQIKTSAALDLDDLRIIGKGVGNIVLEFEADQVEADLNFVGNMELKGAAQELRIDNEGIGNIDASKLICQKVELNSSGIGKVAVHCEEELVMNISGIGGVSYTGNPSKVTENVSGLGKVTRN